MELKPCPFCGGEAEIVRYGTPRYSTQYECTECGCSLETGETFNHGKAWNTRSDKSPSPCLEAKQGTQKSEGKSLTAPNTERMNPSTAGNGKPND